MRDVKHARRFDQQYANAPRHVQTAVDKQLRYLAEDHRHPSLQAKKYKDRWQARATLSWRFYFTVKDGTYVLLSLIPHPK